MKTIEYMKPTNLDEAVGILKSDAHEVRVLAGGTDLLVQMRTGRKQARALLDVKEIPELNNLSYIPGKGLTLGASVPCFRVYRNSQIMTSYPGLIDSASLIGGIQIQGRASIGGNLCNAAPSADAIPVLMALGAVCEIAGPNGIRRVPVENYCTAPGENVLLPEELLVSLHFPAPPPNSGARYIRFIPRNEMDIAVVGAGVSVVLDKATDTFKSARIALASVAPTPLLCQEAGDFLVGKSVNDENIGRAAELGSFAARPISDMRGTAEYRRHLCGVLIKRALKTAVERATEEGS